MLNKAIAIAAQAHAGQTDKGGAPYILHPLRVMMNVEGECEKICAVLHDVVEDSDVTFDDLRREGFGEDVLTVLERLTRRADESYDDFIGRVLHNEIACQVKRADLIDNMDLARIPNPTEKDTGRIIKYIAALKRINKALKAMPPATDITIGECMAAENPIAFELLQKMMVRPAMYLGTSRFNFMDIFFQGFAWKHESFCLLANRPLQYWLLHTQSASLHSGEMVGRQLFYRVFGVRDIAFENYKAFLDAYLSEETEDISFELFSYESEHNTVRYDWEDDVPLDHHEQLAKNVVNEITGMISRAGHTHDALRIYVRQEPLFVQVRFLFHTTDGWNDDAAIIAEDENHDALIALHANARNASAEALQACGCDVNDEIEFSNSWENCEVSDLESLVTDETTFFTESLRWKEEVIGYAV